MLSRVSDQEAVKLAGEHPVPVTPEVQRSAKTRYVLKEQLASGGMGVVWRVFDRSTGNERALKRVAVEGRESPFLLEAFEREYQVLKTLDHPRIIRVFDYGIDEDGPFYTMELLDGQDVRRAAPLPFRRACQCLRDVATSLALLHARRFVHRDLSPGNVRITEEGRAKLLDFGALVYFGSSNVIVGTPPVIAPEALVHAPLDERTDLYALGALAYWMLTGRHAFPARSLDALPLMWLTRPPPPSSFVSDIPEELDALVSSLLDADPLARPASAAEVIVRLTVIGGLPPEDAAETRRLAMSFLSSPRFVGRADILARVRASTERAMGGKGGAVCIEAAPGVGRSRLLEEVGIRAVLAGATVARVDAGASPQSQGTTRALVLRVLDAVPDVAQSRAEEFRPALDALGLASQIRRGVSSARSSPPGVDSPSIARMLRDWFIEVSREKPLVLQVDNVEDADDASLGLLAGLAISVADVPLLIIATVAHDRGGEPALGLTSLLKHSTRLELTGLDSREMLELGRSLFGNAPHVERVSEWLYERTAGSPLHALELARQLLANDNIRFVDGAWALPDRVPESDLPVALEDALSARIALIGKSARTLAECLSLQREQPTLELCRRLANEKTEDGLLSVLDELARKNVLHRDRDGYRFTSSALREALLAGMDEAQLEQCHLRLGNVFLELSTDGDDQALRVQAGFHLIRGGQPVRGADTIASVTHDALTGTLIADLHRVGRPLDAALAVYDRHRRSVYERMPLLAALAQCGYYEEASWGERYGAQALDVLEDLSGVRTARALRRFLGAWLSLIVGILLAFVRFQITPKRQRKYSFDKILIQLFTAVTTLTGAAALSLDGERAARVAATLEPFAMLPERLTPVGIYQFCRALEQITTENEASAYLTFDTLIERFGDPRYYPTLPPEARNLYRAGAHFARGAMAIFRADGRGALESADALDRSGLKLYAMIASQLRWLYYALRGEFSKAAPHQEQVEIHAAHVGSVWQVETWQPPSLLLIYPLMGDIIGSTRLTHRLEHLSRAVPSLRRYARRSKATLKLIRGEITDVETLRRAFADEDNARPRSYIGWARMLSHFIRGLNALGAHAEAAAQCEEALAHVAEEDREYVSHFLPLDIEFAVAHAGLGRFEDALKRIDGLLVRFESREHPLALGLLHEARARIAWAAGDLDAYELSRKETERWFLPTENPALISKCKRLLELVDEAQRPSHALYGPESMDETATILENETENVGTRVRAS